MIHGLTKIIGRLFTDQLVYTDLLALSGYPHRCLDLSDLGKLKLAVAANALADIAVHMAFFIALDIAIDINIYLVIDIPFLNNTLVVYDFLKQRQCSRNRSNPFLNRRSISK